MGCPKKKLRIERWPTSTIPLFTCPRLRMPFSSAALFCAYARAVGGPDRLLLLGVGSVGVGPAHAHDIRQPACLGEGVEHQDQEDRKRRRQKRPWTAQQPRPEEKPYEQDRRRDA